MKKISILIPTYNEVENVEPLVEVIVGYFNNELKRYDYEIVFTDNKSTDGTREKLEEICSKNKKVKAIFNAKNFRAGSGLNGLRQTTGDCTIHMAADFQDPPEMILKFIEEWEKGYKIVIGIKTKSKTSKIMHFIRSMYYKFIKVVSDVEQIEHFTGFALYDDLFMNVIRNLNDPRPYMRGVIAELGFDRKEIEFEQPQRRAGVSKQNFFALYDVAMLGITSYSKIVLRMSTIIGFIISALSFFAAIFYTVMKVLNWNSYQNGIAPILIAILLIGSIQLIFIGLIGEYILNINIRSMNHPFVVEEKRINFD